MTSVGKLSCCGMCGEFHFSPDSMPECSECLQAVVRMRSLIEARGGSLVLVNGRIKVRTAAQRRDPMETVLEAMDVQQALAGEAHR